MGDVAILGTGIIGFISTLTYYLCHIKDKQVTAVSLKEQPDTSIYKIPGELEERIAWTPTGASAPAGQRSGAPARQPPSRWHQSSTPLGSQRYAKVWSFPIRPIRRSQFASILHDVTVGMRKLSAQAPPCMHTTKLITPRQAIRFASSNPVRSRASSVGAL